MDEPQQCKIIILFTLDREFPVFLTLGSKEIVEYIILDDKV